MKYLSAFSICILLLASCDDTTKEQSDSKDTNEEKNPEIETDTSEQVVDQGDLSEHSTDIQLKDPFGTYFEDWMMIQSYDQLVKEFGAGNVTLDSTWEYEGTELKISSKVFLDTGRLVRYVWSDDSKSQFEMIETNLTRYDDTQEKVVWNVPMKTLAGVSMKMSLKELEQLNEAPITFAGFGWDNGGVITSFNNGKLADAPFSITLAPMDYLDNQHPLIDDKYVGDVLFSTDENPEVLEENIVVYGFYVTKQ